MSDVMKAMKQIEARLVKVNQSAEEYQLGLESAGHVDFQRKHLGEATRQLYPTLRDHIGALHSAIARLQGELAKDPDFVCSMFTSVAFTDLFALLPTDWAGETE